MNNAGTAGAFAIDTGIFLRNCNDFTACFPEQAASLGLNHPETALRRLHALPSEYSLVYAKAKGGEVYPTLTVGGNFLHSKYNPYMEAQRILGSEFFQTKAVKQRCIFVGLGLGYLAAQYIEQFPDAEIVLIEADCNVFICFLAADRRSSFFRHSHVSILVGIQPDEALSFLAATGWDNSILFKAPASIEAYKSWYEHFFTLLDRTVMKNSINAKTLERFGTLWLKNTVKNLAVHSEAAKIRCFKDAFPDAAAVVLAGGPSLTEHLKVIAKSNKDFLVIAVDTAVRACLNARIYPDFILSFDPQYWNYLHTAGLDMTKSILVSETSVFPALLRCRCRALFLAHSSAPFARYLEQESNSTADCTLAAGGSVATTAWDFARYIGVKVIVMAGLDLAYPNLQTHFVGSTFEEAAHTGSYRLMPAEQANVKSLYAAFPSLHQDYSGNMVLTDRRMLLYAWWFERTLPQYPEVTTYNLAPHGVCIAGMPACSVQEFTALARGLSRTVIVERLRHIIGDAYSPTFLTARGERQRQLDASVIAMTEGAAALAAQAEKAEALCRRLAHCCRHAGSSGKTGCRLDEYAALAAQLDAISKEIQTGFAKDVVAVLFFNDTNGACEDSEPYTEAEKVYKRIRLMACKVYEVFGRHGGLTFLKKSGILRQSC